MKPHRLLSSLLAGVLILSFTAGCAPASASSGEGAAGAPDAGAAQAAATVIPDTAAPPPSATATPEPTATPASSPTPTPLPPTATPCPPDLCSYAFQYFLQRPISPENNDQVDATYRFGTSQGGRREPHHGVEFLNAHDTPVLAAADGLVVVAGTDAEPLSAQGIFPQVFYGMFASFYGNLVVIEHQVPPALQAAFPEMPLPLYTLYAHLSQISIEPGQQVQAGQEIGKVGMTGVAEGSHLHFEVRLGTNLYDSVRNPELFLAPHSGLDGQPNGGIAGSIVDAQGVPIDLENSLVLVHLPQGPDGPGGYEVYLQDYEDPALAGQPPYADSFAVGDIPPGWYRLSFPHYGLQQHLIEVFPGQLTWFRLVVE